jgi:hypothetical protein
MMYKAKVVVCSEIRTKHSTRSEHHVEFLMLNLPVHEATARLLKVNGAIYHKTNPQKWEAKPRNIEKYLWK